MKKKKKDLEIIFYEGLIKKRPNFVQALYSLGDVYTRKGFYHEGLEVDKKLVQLRPQDPIVHYNLACSFSLTGEIGQAFEALMQAARLGYEEPGHVLKDPDMENLRKDPRFEEFFNNFKNIAQKYKDQELSN